jgi:processing peptidase subunit beta
MFVNSIRVQNKNLLKTVSRDFSSNLNTMRAKPTPIHRLFNAVDTSTQAYSQSTYDPTVALQGLKTNFLNEEQPEYNVTDLNNGFTVLTESQVFPGSVHMGFLIDVGTRDETVETSGSL